MRIISKFNDYYDNGMSFGHDKHTTFVRNTEQIDYLKTFDNSIITKLQNEMINFSAFSKSEKKTYNLEVFKILFCGIVYNAYLVWLDSIEYNKKYFIFYSNETLNEFLHEKQIEFQKSWSFLLNGSYKKEEILNNKNNRQLFDFCVSEKICIAAFRFFNSSKFNDYDFQTSGKFKFIKNSKLKDFEFYRKFDSFTTFQELEMFIGGVLPKTDNGMLSISDKDRIHQHGFDKWSFRKMPS